MKLVSLRVHDMPKAPAAARLNFVSVARWMPKIDAESIIN